MLYSGPIYTIETFPYDNYKAIPIQTRTRGNPRTRKPFDYKDILTAFDIETTAIADIKQSVMYIWQWYFDGLGVCIGRTWLEYLRFILRLRECMKDGERLLCYVHNLSYEFQFLRGVVDFGPDDVFSVKSRKVLRCYIESGAFEYRCSYLQCNMSLDAFTRSMGVEHEKIRGFDYQKLRYPSTELTEFEIQYCVHDVVGLVEAMKIRIDHGGDNFYTVPLTSTGYCRRDAKKAMRHVNGNLRREVLPDYETYKLLRRAFRGGNTHASRFYAGVILDGVKSRDRVSSYPDVLLNHAFPMSAFYEEKCPTIETLYKVTKLRGRAAVFEIEFIDLHLTSPNDCGCPYLSIDKCDVSTDRINDNGRILSASFCRTVLTDIDWSIVLSQYSWSSARVTALRHARYGYLPKPFRDLVIEYFKRKTALKNVSGRELDYAHSKELINALYGMLAQDPAKYLLIFDGENFVEKVDKTRSELLADNAKRAVGPYSWGVWVTAWARWELQRMIDICGRGFVYTDTDSVKYVGDPDFTAYNEECENRSKKSGAFADDPHGVRHYMGVAEFEGEYKGGFKTMGAKKYAGKMSPDGPLLLTLAGVSKKLGAEELERAGGLAAFDEGFIFTDGAGLAGIYNDFPDVPYWTSPDGERLEITSNVYLSPDTYQLGYAAEYRRLLEIINY